MTVPCGHALAALTGGCRICPTVRPDPEPALVPVKLGRLASAQLQARLTAPAHVLASIDEVLERGETAELVEQLRAMDHIACKASLYEFVRLAFAVTNPNTYFEDGPHIRAVCDHVQAQLEDAAACRNERKRRLKVRNLLINIPPRSLKTTILTCATVWAWLHWPTLRIMYLSANPRVAISSARTARDLINSRWFQTTFQPVWNAAYAEEGDVRDDTGRQVDPVDEPELWQIRAGQDALSSLGNTAGGARISRGLSSGITGEGCDVLIIDDPHDVKDGHDKVEKAVEDYISAVHDRLDDPRCSIRICIMQRVRVNDLSARWIEDADNLLHLRLPLEFESHTECPCGTCRADTPNAFGFADWRDLDGETLHSRFDAEYVAAKKKQQLSRYVGLQQQRPMNAGGQIFKTGWWSWYSLTTTTPADRPLGARTEPAHVIGRRRDGSLDLDFLCVSCDISGGSTSKTASNVGVGIIGGKDQRRFLLEDCTDGPKTWLQTMDFARACVLRAVRIAGRQKKIVVLVEKKALGPALIEQLTEYIRDGALKYPDGQPIVASVVAYEPTGKGDKEDRAELMEPDISAGLVYLLDGAHVNSAFRDELEGFPKAAHDDRVDYLSQALDHFRSHKVGWAELFRSRRLGIEAARVAAAQAASP